MQIYSFYLIRKNEILLFFKKIGPQFPFSGKQKMRSTNVCFTDAGANIAFFFCMPKFAGFYFAIYFVKNLSREMLLP